MLEDLRGKAIKMPSKKTSPDATVTIGGKKVKVKDLKGSMRFFETKDKNPKIELDGKKYDLKPVEMPPFNKSKKIPTDAEMEKMAKEKMAKEEAERPRFAEGGKFPDLTGDGEVTQADVLKGRGVFAEGSEVKQAFSTVGMAPNTPKSGTNMSDELRKYIQLQRTLSSGGKQLLDLQTKKDTPISESIRLIEDNFKRINKSDQFKGSLFQDERGFDGGSIEAREMLNDFIEQKTRSKKAEGSLMMPTEGMLVDTYPNIPADEMDEVMASQLPDDEMEDEYISYIMDESLSDSEQDYLAGVLQQDDRLSDILDKVITTASEFSGAGEVEGPGTGVSDSIPARLSDGEFVFTRKATDQIGAENLQQMMDDAERAYDGGYQMKAEGGMMEDENPMSQTQEEIEKLMMGANRMPSLQ